MTEKVLIIDFGSQYTQLIARRVREQNVYCEILPYNRPIELDASIKGVILSGGPSSVYEEDAPDIDVDRLIGEIPLLGICYGAQLLSYKGAGTVENSNSREFGRAHLRVNGSSPLLKDVPDGSQIWMSHGDTITQLAPGYELIATTDAIPTAAFQNLEKQVFALQFHPEVTHSEDGGTIVRNFLYNICGMTGDWTPSHFVESTVAALKEQIGDGKEQAKKLQNVDFLAQGTIYPDVIESVSVKGPSATIKSHHNVGGLPASLNLKVVEPLRFLFKDEVRNVGLDLGLAKKFIARHPFPGPGLAIRILGDITPAKIAVLQEVDHIFISGLHEYDLYDKTWQAFAVLLPVSSVGVMGDERTYEKVVALRTVTSRDGMTADWGRLPYDFLAEVSNRIINNVKGVNRVVYDISSKPPATIEWE
ncbi:UNVERIFIED_CONTAM: hypothetical protein GTU68_029093 [Idotea baltica]|nr:hypothetical protein [Idotea baltica]